MKVLFVSEYFPPASKGGGEISAYMLAKELAKNIEIHVLTSDFENLKKEEIKDNIHIHRRLKTGKNPVSLIDNIKRNFMFEKSLIKELNELDKKEDFDIIHCFNITSIRAVKLKDKLRKKFVLHVNSPVLFCPKGTLMYKDEKLCERECTRTTYLGCFFKSDFAGKKKLKSYLKYNPGVIYSLRKRFENFQKLLPSFDHYMPISEYMKKRLSFSGIRSNVSVVYNIMDLPKITKARKNKTPKILYLGEYSKPKGPQILIQALKEMKSNYECNFYGSGTLKSYLDSEIKKHNLNAHVKEKVKHSKIPSILAKYDVVVIPSLVGEAFGRVAVEAASAGLPVVASDIGGLSETVKSGETGFLVKPGDVTKLSGVLEKLLNNKTLRKQLGKNAKKFVKKFSKEKTVKGVIHIYNKLFK